METTDTTLIVPDFSAVQDTVGEGIYKARIVDSKMDKWTGKDGKPDTRLVVWTMETFGETEDKNNGRKIFHRTPVEGPGAFRFKNFYQAAMGEEYPVGKGFDRTMLHGRELEVTITQQKNNPQYTEVSAVKAITH